MQEGKVGTDSQRSDITPDEGEGETDCGLCVWGGGRCTQEEACGKLTPGLRLARNRPRFQSTVSSGPAEQDCRLVRAEVGRLDRGSA